MLRTQNKKIALVLFIFSILYLILAFNLPSYPYVPIDADAVPIGLGFILASLSVALYFQKDGEKSGTDDLKRADLVYILSIIGMIVLYIALLEVVGFIIITTLFIFFCSLFLGYKRHFINLVVSLGIPLFIYVLFDSFLQVQLPMGLLPF